MDETVVMSVGGSIIVPDAIDIDFLTEFKRLVEDEVAKGRHFIIIAGGGRTARNYQKAAATITELTSEDIDWIGLHATRLNGHLLRTIFHEIAHPVMVTNPDDILDIRKDAKVVVAAGYRPGASTDLRSIQIAEHIGAKRVANLSNIDYVYTADPKKDSTANKIENIAWTEFRKLLPSEWDPGLSMPFDPIAAHLAERLSIEVAVINGRNLEEVKHYLNGESFIGTKIY